ncbi:MAG: UDP-N-acetylglucosamine 2-epimerase [Gammaproteobacteria bacterium SG8_11]|nr:MAG: UDP-N-acetylglucosamine 2-epimerase [Gammaproteobacteria bacterium SG8_11]
MPELAAKNPIRIAVVTGSRADYGLLYSVMRAIDNEPLFELQTVITGMHLSAEFGDTYKTIAADGFDINARVDCLLSGDSPVATAKSMGLGVIGFAEALRSLSPNMLLVLGDRFEIFAAVQTALILNIPVAHIAGGDTTEGAYDESLRHSITKMAHLHFATNEQAAQRIQQLGENPKHVFNVGSPGIDLIVQTPLLSKLQLAERLNTKLCEKLFLVTFHPTTLDATDVEQQCHELTGALDHYRHDCSVLITKANADAGGRRINQLLADYISQRKNTMIVTSMGQQLYYSAIAAADVVIGNSSSGLYEAPTLKTPTVNIGDRQKGRLRAHSVVDCGIDKEQILNAIEIALKMDCEDIVNPYGDGHASEKIMTTLREFADKNRLNGLLKKHFYGLTDGK